MPNTDPPLLESSRAKKEPILNKGWWLTLLIFFAVTIFGQVVIRPVAVAVHSYLMDVTSF